MGTKNTNILISALLGVAILVLGTVGYMLLEKWSALEGLYMTIITVATIGYGEIRPLSPAGRILTLFIIVFGVGNSAYLIGQLTKAMVEGSLQKVMGRRRLESQIKKIKDHYILCGYGRIGRMIAGEIVAKKLPLVVIENDQRVLDLIEKDNLFYIKGDASDEENMVRAGIGRAAGLISAVSSDADNLYIVLTARGLNPDIFILTRASEERSIKKLRGAGADQVISPYAIGAKKMAQTILRPAVSDFWDTTESREEGITLAMEEMLVTPESEIKDVTLMKSNIRRDMDLIIIAIKKASGRMLFNPSAHAEIKVGDTLIAVGQRENMDRLSRLLGADKITIPNLTKLKRDDRMSCKVE